MPDSILCNLKCMTNKPHLRFIDMLESIYVAVAYRGGLGFKPPPLNSEGPPKSYQTQPDCENCKKLLNLGRQHPKMFGKKGSKILKLPRFAIVLH